MRIAPRFICARRFASIRLRVAASERDVQRHDVGLREQCIERTAARHALRSTPASVAVSCGVAADHPHARSPVRAVRSSRPMPPKPTIPSVLPPSSRPFDKRRARPLAGGHGRGRRVGAAQQQHRRPDHVLGHRERVGAGRRNDRDAAPLRRLRRRCCRVPRPSRPTTLSAGAAASSAPPSPACGCARSARLRRPARRRKSSGRSTSAGS